jgi:hypothetical protein
LFGGELTSAVVAHDRTHNQAGGFADVLVLLALGRRLLQEQQSEAVGEVLDEVDRRFASAGAAYSSRNLAPERGGEAQGRERPRFRVTAPTRSAHFCEWRSADTARGKCIELERSR